MGSENNMVMVMSRFVIANDLVTEVKQAFANRPGLVDRAPGFIRMSVVSPQETPNEIWLITYWRDKASYEVWHRSHAYHDSHRGIPKGLKLVPGSTEVRTFDVVSE